MRNISIWKDTIKEKNYEELKDNKEVDVLIIGGGITGVSTLYNLKDSKLKVMLVEQNKIGQSTTGGSTGKLEFLQNDLIDKIRKNFGDKIAKKYIKSQQDAIKNIVETINKEKIDCDLEKVNSILYTNQKDEISKIKNLVKFIKECDTNIKKVKPKDINLIKSKYIIQGEKSYIFHPIKYLYGLLKNNSFPIYENTSIKRIEKEKDYYICYTEKNTIKTKWVVIASHYPYFNFPYLFPIKVSLEKSYLSASKYKGNKISLISYSYPFISMRSHKNFLVYLSNSHPLNKHIEAKQQFNELTKKLNDLKLKPEYLWSNIDIMTNDGLPYIGRLKGNILIATGYNTWGLTNGSLAGSILSDIITNNPNKYIELFDPKRISITNVLGVISNIVKNISSFIKSYIFKSDNIEYTKKDNKSIMIYKDDKEHIVNRKCPHFGCGLTFNEVEKTWDCPCHGSRFNLNGKIVMSPSNHDICINGKNKFDS